MNHETLSEMSTRGCPDEDELILRSDSLFKVDVEVPRQSKVLFTQESLRFFNSNVAGPVGDDTFFYGE